MAPDKPKVLLDAMRKAMHSVADDQSGRVQAPIGEVRMRVEKAMEFFYLFFTEDRPSSPEMVKRLEAMDTEELTHIMQGALKVHELLPAIVMLVWTEMKDRESETKRSATTTDEKEKTRNFFGGAK